MWFQVLGPVAAYDGQRPVALGPPRQRCVLAVLLAEPGVLLSADQLVDRVWGETLPQRARQTLHTHLSRLRAVLTAAGGPSLVRRASSYALAVDPSRVDLHHFRALAGRARAAGDDNEAAALWDEALGLWRGTAFADLGSEWLLRLAERLTGERWAAVLDRNDVLLRRGEHARLLPELTAAAAEHPLDERLAAQLMQALYRCDRPSDALAHYREVHDRLAEQLGTDPGPTLRQLHQRILRQEEPQAAPVMAAEPTGGADAVLAQLPADIPGFTGREDSLRRLDALLESVGQQPATVVISAIGGSAGVGKTSLAVHWSHRVRDQFPDGQLYLNLRGFDPDGRAMEPAEALRALLELLQVPSPQIPTSVAAQTGLYRSRLAGARMLVVLDNARDAEQVRPLLPSSPGSMVLVTSRNRLTGLVAAEGAHPLRLDVLDDAEAWLLLCRRLGQERLAAEPAAVAEIVAACAGVPLALAVVAARAATRPEFPLATLAAELADARSRLDALASTDTATDLRAVFSWSYRALTPPAARLFRLLGLYPGGQIAIDAAASLAGLPTSQVRRPLDELTGVHLLTEQVSGRYTRHDLLRDYASELAATEPADGRAEATHRLVDHYVHTAHRSARLLNPRRHTTDLPPVPPGVSRSACDTTREALEWLTAEQRVLLSVLTLADRNGLDAHTWQLGWALADFLVRRGRWHELLTTQQTALAAAERLGDPRMCAEARRQLGIAFRNRGRYAEAADHLRQALTGFGSLGDRLGQAGVHTGLSILSGNQGRYREALGHSEQAMSLFEALGDQVGLAGALNGTGWWHAQLGDYQQSLACCRRALKIFEVEGHPFGTGQSWDSLGFVHHRLGEYQRAMDCYRRAIELFCSEGNQGEEAESLVSLAMVQEAAGDPGGAKESRLRALEIYEEIAHPDTEQLRQQLK